MNIGLAYFIIFCLFCLFIWMFVLWLKIKIHYKNIIDIDTECNKRYKIVDKLTNDINDIRTEYKNKKLIYDELLKKIRILEEDEEMINVGFYKPHYSYRDSESYKIKINQIREQQKEKIKNDKAIICHTSWTANGSHKEGERMTNKYKKLMLRAFNNECETILLNVKWNNIDKMEARLEKAFTDINKFGENYNIDIQLAFLKLKKEELWLTYEYEQKKYEEKEEQKRIKEQIREEEKRAKEIERKKKEIEEEEKRKKELQDLYTRAFNEGANEQAEKYKNEFELLNKRIEEQKRAVSQAQLTKAGYIYVISNIGSFGENVYKIGMTRRFDPMERVNELGDASVPFKFDVHAMIETDNAPALENKLHEIFKNRSVNRVNYKKEFFNVSLEEIQKVVNEFTNSEIEFTKLAEAREYRETLAIIRAENKLENVEETKEDFPLEI